MQNLAPETGRHHNIRQRLPAAFFQPAADLRAALAAQRQAKLARAADREAQREARRVRTVQIEAEVRRYWPAGASAVRIAMQAECSDWTVRDTAKRLGLTRGGS